MDIRIKLAVLLVLGFVVMLLTAKEMLKRLRQEANPDDWKMELKWACIGSGVAMTVMLLLVFALSAL